MYDIFWNLGSEITTSYLKCATEDSSRKIRKQALSQYLFECDCGKCKRELKENKEVKAQKKRNGECEEDDSDDDDY
jgi:hypothetical protein